jgi:hypothetical protein
MGGFDLSPFLFPQDQSLEGRYFNRWEALVFWARMAHASFSPSATGLFNSGGASRYHRLRYLLRLSE